jgi:hypothetical protein
MSTVEEDSMDHKSHMFMMVALMVAAIALFSTGYGGGWVLFALLGACAVMMVSMMRGMGGDQHHGGMDGDRSEGSADATPRTTGHEHH